MVVIVTVGLLLARFISTSDAPIDFTRDVRPLLSDRCFQCHGPDAQNRKADLRLDIEEGAVAPRGVRPSVIVRGSAESLFVQRIFDPDHGMPPKHSGKTLDERERETLLRWVEQGAPWELHWAFAPPRASSPPDIDDDAWSVHPIDRFLLSRLRSEGLGRSKRADPAVLVRRVYLDLIGLPPTPRDVIAFANDATEKSWEQLVDRLLASPQYGENMARPWLDAARYGDTHGLHLDNYREMWPYRDWVVRAFNEGMPFDQFTIEQIAGDLLPNATLDQLIASGFNRCHVSTSEGGAIEEEVHIRNVIDRVSTTATVFLGLTLGCATCHDHKFDPFSQREFYQLSAFFNNMDGSPLDGNAKDWAPVIQVPTLEQKRRLEALRDDLSAAEQAIERALDTIAYEEPRGVSPSSKARTIVWIDDDLPPGAATQGQPFEWVSPPRYPVRSGKRAMRRSGKGLHQHLFPFALEKLRVETGDEISFWIWLDPDDPPREIMLQVNTDGHDGWKHRAFWGDNAIDWGRDGTLERYRVGDLPPAGRWTKLEVDTRTLGVGPGTPIHGLAFTQFDGTAIWDHVALETTSEQGPEDFAWIDDDPPSGAQLQGDSDIWQWTTEDPYSGTRSLERKGSDHLHQDFFTNAPPLRLQHGDVFFAHVWLDPDDPPRSIQLQWNDGQWDHRARWGEPAHGAGHPRGADLRLGDLPEKGRWIRLEVPIEKVDLGAGTSISGWAFTQVGGTVRWDRAGVRTWGPPDERSQESLDAWELAAANDPSVPETIRTAIAKPASFRTADEKSRLQRYYVRHIWREARDLINPLESKVTAIRADVTALEMTIPTTLVMKERTQPLPAYLLDRGLYDQRREQVERRTPSHLPAMSPDLPRDRLGFARWLVDPQNPLTARVTVNRFWQQIFGTGLVKTSDDFGNQGEPPSHPELLDWLAVQFIETGWNVKAFIKQLVMTEAYRQDSRVDAERLRRDLENRLLSRGSRYRLDAEVLRDQALAVSGLLVRTIGGPSVKPPQPDGLWRAVAYTSSNTAQFTADTGPDRVHRRTLYTFLKRTAPPPQMSTLDAPNRETCCVRRERTNTPLQALLLMNDPQYVEAARVLAQKVMSEKSTDRERAHDAFLRVASRTPQEAELETMLALLEDVRTTYKDDPESAQALLSIGEAAIDDALDPVDLASWTLVTNGLLNLDEVVTKH